MNRALVLVLVLGACGGDDAGPGVDAAEPVVPTIAPAAGFLRVADPLLPGFDGWPMPLAVTGGSRCRLTIGALVALEGCDARWDGAGATVGALPVVAALVDDEGATLAETRLEIHVVRVGLHEVQLASPERVPLLWPAVDGLPESFWESDPAAPPWRAASLGDAPPVWTDLGTPPAVDLAAETSYNLPIAVVAGATLVGSATLYEMLGAAEVRVVPPPLQAPGAVDRVDLVLSWGFEGRAGDGEWQPMPGAAQSSHRVYALAGPPALGFSDSPHRAWIDVVDTVTRWVGGATADPLEVAGAVVEGVYYDLGLSYDVESGASAYTWYAGNQYEEAQFALSAFRAREFGSIINCSDAASLVMTYASMVGVDLRYHILTSPAGAFDLNYIQAIGYDVFDETPFVGDRGSFRYHAVVGPSSGSFFDGTLALDGDGDAAQPPHVVLLPVDLPAAAYLEALSSEYQEIVVNYDEKVRLH